MAKFMNIVRCKVKSSNREEYLKKIDDMPKFDGQISAKYVETKPNEFFMIGEWNSEIKDFIIALGVKSHIIKIIVLINDL